ncbi:unnamed protein product [Clonostachys rosea f. rosea IK726]|uniref:Uncharacterized protein n=1 Tax=Clonostachys rosea f. rosea IK726 TaxID=1349383 RepID=A0ACA9TIZ8_BIOOC|nr:unnamed protein product [Clonostachys rosea f. rosea IK726]
MASTQSKPTVFQSFDLLDAVVGAETLAVFVLAHGEDYVSTEMKLVGFAVVGYSEEELVIVGCRWEGK